MFSIAAIRKAFAKSDAMAFLVVVVAAYLITFQAGNFPTDPATATLFLALAFVYLFAGVYVSDLAEQSQSLFVRLSFFAFTLPISGLMLYLSNGNAWLAILPLAGVSVVLLPRWGMLLVNLCMLAIMALVGYRLTGNWDFFTSSILSLLAAQVFVVVFTQITVSEQKARAEIERLAGELRQANQQLRQYAAQVEELATMQERNRLAREIHDGLGHYLTSINMQIKAAQAVWEQDPARAADALGKAQSLTQEALADVRRSVAALRADPIAGKPLPDAIRLLLPEVEASGLRVDLDVQGTPHPLGPQAELTLYRAAQEALTNVCKHARASRVQVRLAYEANRIRLTVEDDGAGLADGAADDARGFGLVGLRERAQLLGGTFSAGPRDGGGFRIELEMPA